MRYSWTTALTLTIAAIASGVASAGPVDRTAGSKIEGDYTGTRPRMVYRTYRTAPRYVFTNPTAPAAATTAKAVAPTTRAPVAEAPAQPAPPTVAQNQPNGATRSFSYQPEAGTATTAPVRTYYQHGRRARGARYLDASRKPLGEY